MSGKFIRLHRKRKNKTKNRIGPLYLFVGPSVGFRVGPSVGWGVGLFVGAIDGALDGL